MQMNRLQTKLRYFIRIEKELRQKIRNVTEKDENLVTILEEAICFGKVLFIIKPVASENQRHPAESVKRVHQSF